jgi:hypothetical protein
MDAGTRPSVTHLTDDELFALALPPTGAPEPLPVHLAECLRCSRVLADWKTAVSDVGAEDEETIARRSDEEWESVESATLDAIRRAGRPGRGRTARTLRWALPVAASLLLFGVLVFERSRDVRPPVVDDLAGLSSQDRADDDLLLDVERLASGEEPNAAWSGLAPDPSAAEAIPAAENGS